MSPLCFMPSRDESSKQEWTESDIEEHRNEDHERISAPNSYSSYRSLGTHAFHGNFDIKFNFYTPKLLQTRAAFPIGHKDLRDAGLEHGAFSLFVLSSFAGLTTLHSFW